MAFLPLSWPKTVAQKSSPSSRPNPLGPARNTQAQAPRSPDPRLTRLRNPVDIYTRPTCGDSPLDRTGDDVTLTQAADASSLWPLETRLTRACMSCASCDWGLLFLQLNQPKGNQLLAATCQST